MVRPVADRMPLVTDSVNVPSGLPIAIAVWPTWSFVSSPMTAGVSPVALILISARSVSVEILDHGGIELPAVGELDASATGCRPTTCRLVRM